MAGALFALVALPALAAPGTVLLEADSDTSLRATVITDDTSAVADTGLFGATPSVAGDGSNTADSKLGATAYVSNQFGAYNLVIIAAADPTTPTRATVRSSAGSHNIALDGSGTGYFWVTEERTTEDTLSARYGAAVQTAYDGLADDADLTVDGAQTKAQKQAVVIANINAREVEAFTGETITITSVGLSVRLSVDGEAPSITVASPSNGAVQSSGSVLFDFTVSDSDSGLRRDSSTGPDTDGLADEPLSLQYGYSADIALFLNEDSMEPARTGADFDTAPMSDTRSDSRASQAWTEVEKDHAYSTSFRRSGLAPERDDAGKGSSKKYYWYLAARDRVGNVAETDSKPTEEESKSNYSFTVDNESPSADGQVYAGIGFDTGDREEVNDSSAILVVFSNEGNGLDTSSIDKSDFAVEGNTVVDVIHPNKKKGKAASGGGCDGDTGIHMPDDNDCIDTRNRVYLVLASPLGDNETPEVEVRGPIRDTAGNTNDVTTDDAFDRIGPSLTVSVSTDTEASGRPLAKEEITVRVTAGEPLIRNPRLFVVQLDANGRVAQEGDITGSVMRNTSEAWTYTLDVEKSGDDSGLYALVVMAEDRFDNSVYSKGGKSLKGYTDGVEGKAAVVDDPDTSEDETAAAVALKVGKSGTSLDVAKLLAAGLLVEFDDDIAAATAEVLPMEGDLATESMNPFVELTFAEGKEYKSTGVDTYEGAARTDSGANKLPSGEMDYEAAANDNITYKDEKYAVDSHDRVTVTAATIDGADVPMSQISSLTKEKYSIALVGLSIGDHTLGYTAVDEAGNEIEEEVDFEVKERSPYEVSLRPGWNLISLPANPSDSSLDSVLPSGHPSQTVLSYQNGEWVSASRDAETGMWGGTLTDMTAGHGYFVQTTGFDDLSTAIPESNPTTLLPTVNVVQGWNLLGVVDAGQADPGDEAGKFDADDYFTSIEWRVAYSFNANTSRWMKLTPSTTTTPSDDMVETGIGYWVWVNKAGTLVP